jgi:DNA helicase II / ATP-dependent DNA helicase PcrA
LARSDITEEENLDEEQLAAVTATDRAIAVLAGPGSGKTRTLSYRARHLLLEHPDTRALLMTFTNKAAAEMKTRAMGVSLVASDRIEASTFHTFGANLLRSHGDLIGISPEFDIIDADESALFAAEVAARTGMGDRHVTWARRRRRRLEMSAPIAEFGEAYESAKRGEGIVDFDDLVVYPAELLEGNEALAAAYGARLQHLLVDEFQDTNATQFAIVKALFPHVQTVSVFADDDQAIFRFADADVANIRHFAQQLSAVGYPLTCNYRCPEVIVERANLLIAAEPTSSGRQMRADKAGGEIYLHGYSSTEEEADAVGREIADAVHDEGTAPASIAVLVRSGPRANEIVAELERHSVPLNDWRGAAYHPTERRALITCMSAVRAKLTNRQARALSEFMGVPLVEERDTHGFLEGHESHPIAIELLQLRHLAFGGARPQDVVAQAQTAAAVADPALANGMQPLVDAVGDFERFDPNYTLEHLLVDLALKSGGRPPTEGGGVKVASLHGTKGLQWPTVYLVGLEEGKLPDFRAETPEQLAEERRACFVGVCRAEESLTLTYARRFRTHHQTPSRFLREMQLI